MQKVDALMIGNELNGAGVKDKTLPASKLKTDTDADKIQLENLSAEVLENMSGQAAATANTAAATADQATADALDAAALAESKAALADEKAAYAVTKADLAQTAKDHADQKAALAQTQADYAKTQGDYGKAQGDYAKAQGDLAKGVVAGVIPNATQAASGLMSPTDKIFVEKQIPAIIMGSKVVTTSTASYTGKLNGNMTSNPHISRVNSSETLATPTSGSEVSDTSYTRMQIRDATYASPSITVANRIPQQYFSFDLIAHVERTYGILIPGSSISEKVSWLRASVIDLRADWYGFGANPTGSKANFTMWNSASSFWNAPTSHSNNSTAALAFSSSSILSRIDNNGFTHFLAYTEPSDGTTTSIVHTDYIELRVQLAVDITTNLIPATQSTSGAMSSLDKVVLDKTIPSVFMGNKLALQSAANFVGKMAGSTTANPHIAKYAGRTTIPDPSSANYAEYVNDGGNPNIAYSKLSVSDGLVSIVSTAGAVNMMAMQLFSFNLIEHVQRTYGMIPGVSTADKVAWLKSNVSKIVGNWNGLGSSPTGNKANLTAWNAEGNAWFTTIRSHNVNTITKLELNIISLTATIGRVIDSNGFVHFLAYAEATDGVVPSTIQTDYVELVVELTTDIKSNLLLNGVQGYKLTKDDGLVIRLADNTDLNTILDTGLYYIVTPPNAPEPNNGWYIDVKKLTSVYVTQKATMNNATRQTEYVRHFFNGAWTPWSRSTDTKQTISSFMGASVVDQSIANYVGKVSGSTTANPHIGGRRTESFLGDPTVSNQWVEYADTGGNAYSRIGMLDGLLSTTATGTSGRMAIDKWSFNLISHIERTYGPIPASDVTGKVAWIKTNVKSLTANWYGFGTSPTGNKATFTAWFGSWETGTVNATNIPSKLTRTYTDPTLIANRIQADGFVHFLAYAEPSDGTTASSINTDYVELVVEVSTNAKTNLLAQGFQGHKLTTDTGTAITPPNGTDFNSLVDTGYYVYSNDNAHKGSPNGYPFWLVEVTKYSATLSVQTWKGIVHDEVFMRRTVTGGWSPFRKNVDENALANVMMGNKPTLFSTASFLGKVAGSTTANPHTVKFWATIGTLNPPNGSWNEAIQSGYNNMTSVDGTLYRATNNVSGGQIQHIFNFNLLEHIQRTYGTIPGATTADKALWLKTNISRLTFNWWGFGSSPAGNRATLRLWNGTNWATFNTVATHTNASTAKLSDAMITSAQIGVGIQSDGFVHALVYAEASDGTTLSDLNTDAVSLDVELSTDIKTNLLLNGVQGHKLTQDDSVLITPANFTNFDTVTNSGMYRYAIDNNHTGAPDSSGYWTVFVQKYTSNSGTQFWICVSGDQAYFRRMSGGVWSPWRKVVDSKSLIGTLMGNSVTDQSLMNFVGKVSGSTTVNPHVVTQRNSVGLETATSTAFEFADARYQVIVSADGLTTSTTTSVNGEQSKHRFSFNVLAHVERLYGTVPGVDIAGKIAWLKTNITKLTATWHGFGTGPTGNKASLTRWDANAGAWLSTAVTGTTHTGSGVLPLTFTPGVATSIDANGFMHLLVFAEPSDGTTASVINTDFVEVKVDLDTSLKKNLAPVWVDAVLQNGWVEFEAGQKPQYSLGSDGFVTLKGAVKSGTFGSSTPAYYLPSGMRPPRTVYLFATGVVGNVYRVIINSTGNVYIEQSVGSNGNAFVSLDGIRFPIN